MMGTVPEEGTRAPVRELRGEGLVMVAARAAEEGPEAAYGLERKRANDGWWLG
jgi:hypothetical protein